MDSKEEGKDESKTIPKHNRCAIFLISEISHKAFLKLKKENPKAELEKVGPRDLIVPTETILVFDSVFSIDTWTLLELFQGINSEVRFDFISSSKFKIKEMSSISCAIALEVGTVLRNHTHAVTGGVPPFPGQCGTMQAQWRDGWMPPERRIPDVWWIRTAAILAMGPAVNNMLVGVPDFVLEVVSPNDTIIGQRDKMGTWITAGVEFAIFVDYIRRRTYRYATTASGLLPAPGAHANVLAHPHFAGITEEQFIWPGLVAAVPQYGPAGFVVSIPAGTLIGIALGGAAININHGLFWLG